MSLFDVRRKPVCGETSCFETLFQFFTCSLCISCVFFFFFILISASPSHQPLLVKTCMGTVPTNSTASLQPLSSSCRLLMDEVLRRRMSNISGHRG